MKNAIDGITFRDMILSGLNNLRHAEEKINLINVFPVPDNDTGTNMRLTLQHGFESTKENANFSAYLNDLSSGMVFGARGNSGVILSQLFKGMSYSLAGKVIVSPHEFTNGLVYGYKSAYKSIFNPTEGTILTVAREAVEAIKFTIRGRVNMTNLFDRYLSQLYISLKNTPELLPCLKEAQVIDSGALAYIKIIEGMYKALLGTPITEDSIDAKTNVYPEYMADFKQQTIADIFKPVSILSVVTGAYIIDEFKEYGADYIIEAGPDMNVSLDEFKNAINKIKSDKIIIIPNSLNNIKAANDCIKQMKINNVIVIESKDLIQGYYALQMDIPDNDINSRVLEMKKSIKEIQTFEINSKEYAFDLFKESFLKIGNLDEKVGLVLIFNEDVNEDTKDKIMDYVYDNYPFIEVKAIDGGKQFNSIIGGIF